MMMDEQYTQDYDQQQEARRLLRPETIEQLEQIEELDWHTDAMYDSDEFDEWCEEFGLWSSYWDEFEYDNGIGSVKGYYIFDPNHLFERIVSAMNYSIEQARQKNYQEVQLLNERLMNVELWVVGDASEFFDGPAILEFFFQRFPGLEIPMNQFGKKAFVSAYNNCPPEDRNECMYHFLNEYANMHWMPFSLRETVEENRDELPDWDHFLADFYPYVKEHEKWSMRVLGHWGDEFYIMLNGPSAYLHQVLKNNCFRLHVTDTQEKRIKEKLSPDLSEFSGLESWCIHQILLDESNLSYDEKSNKILAQTPAGDFRIHGTSYAVSLAPAKKKTKKN